MAKGYAKVVEKKDGNKNITYNINNLKLYRYRTINKITINSLKNNTVFGTVPSMFNDPYDCCSYYYDKNIIKEIVNDIYGIDLRALNKELRLFLSVMKREILRKVNGCAVGCFSENVKSPIMWAHYAGQAKGFAIEYSANDLYNTGQNYLKLYKDEEFEQYENLISNKDKLNQIISTLEQNSSNYGLLPVQYSNKLYNLYSYVDIEKEKERLREEEKRKKLNTSFSFEDDFDVWYISHIKQKDIINKMLLTTKNRDWKYEREWRLCLPLTFKEIFAETKYKNFGEVKPLAIYMGEDIEEKNFDILIEIAEEKQIPIYQMYIDITKKNNQLSCFRVG